MNNAPAAAARQPELHGPSATRKNETFAIRFANFWWVGIPAKLRRYSTLLWAVWSDGLYLTAWPRLAMILVFAALLFGFCEGITHWSYRTIVGTNGFAGNVLAPAATADNWGGPTRLVFADNLVLLLVTVGLGTVSANLGTSLVIGYALGDLLHGAIPPQPGWRTIDPVNAWIYRHVPLLTSYILFCLLAAMPIVMAMELARSSNARVRQSKPLTVGLTAILQALLIFCWGAMAPMVFRTVLLWAGGVPRINVPFYTGVTLAWLVPTAIIAVLVRAVLFGATRNNQQARDHLAAARSRARQAKLSLPAWGRALIVTGVVTLLLMGFLHTPTNFEPQILTNFGEAEIIFIALFAASLISIYWLPRMAFWQRWVGNIERYPAAVRLAAATVLAYLVCLLIIAIPGVQSVRPGEFGPEVAAILVGLGLTLVLLPNGWFGLPQSSRFPGLRLPVLSPAARTGMVLLFILVATRNAFADCSDFVCCFVSATRAVGAALAATATAGGIPLLGGLLGSSGPRSSPEGMGRSSAGPAPSSLTNPEGNTVRSRGTAAHSHTPTRLTGSEAGAVRSQNFTPQPTPEGTPVHTQSSAPLTDAEGGAMQSQPPNALTNAEGAMKSPPAPQSQGASSPEGIGNEGQAPTESGGTDLLPDWWGPIASE